MVTVLIVDDSATVRAALRRILAEIGLDVLEAPDGNTALGLLDNEPCDAAILDLNMPGMNGIEFIKEVRKLPAYKFMPILFLTTESQQSMRMEAKAAGASGWLVKPATADELINTIKLVLR